MAAVFIVGVIVFLMGSFLFTQGSSMGEFYAFKIFTESQQCFEKLQWHF